MSQHPFYQIDAYTTRRLAGNPCAVLFDCDDMSDELMLRIAKENNLSETAFVSASERADIRVRFFTTVHELPLAGHPTVATAHALIEAGRLKLQGETTTFKFEMLAGIIEVTVAVKDGQRLYTMRQKKPEFFEYIDRSLVAKAYGLEVDDLLADVEPQLVSTGTKQLMIPVRTLSALKKIRSDVLFRPEFKRIAQHTAFFFTLDALHEQALTFARCLPPGHFEDSFTGSATGNMAAYLWHHRLITTPTFTAEQGHWLGRPGEAFVEIEGEPDNITAIKVSGHAVTSIVGEFAAE